MGAAGPSTVFCQSRSVGYGLAAGPPSRCRCASRMWGPQLPPCLAACARVKCCLLYTSPSPRDSTSS
eukprot:9536821-Prorocentrum_lima.AAC.1